MSRVLDLLYQARAARDEARRARRLAGALTQADDQSRLLRYADGQDLMAAGMEQQATQQASASMDSAMQTVHRKRPNPGRDATDEDDPPSSNGPHTKH